MKTVPYFTIDSAYHFQESVLRLRKVFGEKGIRVFAEIDHRSAAKDVGLDLAPTTVLILGNPKVGTALMQENHALAIHLPAKVLVYEENQKVRVCYQKIGNLEVEYQLKTTKGIPQKIDEGIQNLISLALQIVD